MFAAIVRGIDAGELEAIAVQAENAVASAPAHLRKQVVTALGQAILRDLLGGALVERGAEIETSLGVPLPFRWSGTTVAPGILA